MPENSLSKNKLLGEVNNTFIQKSRLGIDELQNQIIKASYG